MSDPSVWPRRSDSLMAGGDWKAESLFTAFSSEWFYDYAVGYRAAADALVEDVLAARLVPDSVCYPVLFLYRHYVELILKGIIDFGSRLGNNDIPKGPEDHQISKLWRQARGLLEREFPKGKKEDLDAVEKCIDELTAIDSCGEGFRYGAKKRRHGEDLMWGKHTQLNLDNVRCVMQHVGNLLESSYECMFNSISDQADWRSN
jgi:hypothetical protein